MNSIAGWGRAGRRLGGGEGKLGRGSGHGTAVWACTAGRAAAIPAACSSPSHDAPHTAVQPRRYSACIPASWACADGPPVSARRVLGAGFGDRTPHSKVHIVASPRVEYTSACHSASAPQPPPPSPQPHAQTPQSCRPKGWSRWRLRGQYVLLQLCRYDGDNPGKGTSLGVQQLQQHTHPAPITAAVAFRPRVEVVRQLPVPSSCSAVPLPQPCHGVPVVTATR